MYPLVLVGADGWKNSQLMACIEPLARAGQIISPGYLSSSSLLHLFSSAAVFAYPSLYEGFGLPVAEAMASGASVLTSNVTSIPEVTNGVALEVDPYSVDAIEAGLERLLTDAALRDLLVEKGLRRAAELTWDATVAGVVRRGTRRRRARSTSRGRYRCAGDRVRHRRRRFRQRRSRTARFAAVQRVCASRRAGARDARQCNRSAGILPGSERPGRAQCA